METQPELVEFFCFLSIPSQWPNCRVFLLSQASQILDSSPTAFPFKMPLWCRGWK